jgi:hypothetical protein
MSMGTKKLDKTSEVKVEGQLHLELSQFPPQLLSSFCWVSLRLLQQSFLLDFSGMSFKQQDFSAFFDFVPHA